MNILSLQLIIVMERYIFEKTMSGSVDGFTSSSGTLDQRRIEFRKSIVSTPNHQLDGERKKSRTQPKS